MVLKRKFFIVNINCLTHKKIAFYFKVFLKVKERGYGAIGSASVSHTEGCGFESH